MKPSSHFQFMANIHHWRKTKLCFLLRFLMTSCGRRSPICRHTPPLRIPLPSQDILLEGIVTLKTCQGVSLLETASGQGRTQAGGSMPPYSHTSGGTHLRYVSYCELPRGLSPSCPEWKSIHCFIQYWLLAFLASLPYSYF